MISVGAGVQVELRLTAYQEAHVQCTLQTCRLMDVSCKYVHYRYLPHIMLCEKRAHWLHTFLSAS